MKSWELVNLVHSADIRPPSAKLLLSIMAAGTSSQTGVHVSSMERLARLAGIGEREARRIVSRLRAEGVLHVVANQWGGAAGTCPAYRLDAAKLGGLALRVIHTEGVHAPRQGAESCPHGGRTGSETEGVHALHTESLQGIQAPPVDNADRRQRATATNSRPPARRHPAGGAAAAHPGRQAEPQAVAEHLAALLARTRAKCSTPKATTPVRAAPATTTTPKGHPC